MTDDFPEEEFAPIAAAIKQLPYFSPSRQFADNVMSRVHVKGVSSVPAKASPVSIQPAFHRAPVERRTALPARDIDIRRSVPARLAATALAASIGLTMTVVVLVAMFDVNLFVLISRIFGQSTMNFLASLTANASAWAQAITSSTVAAAGTATGLAVVGSFAAGVVASTAVLRAAASASRKAA